MNILLWVLQIILGLWSIAGGTYMMNHFVELSTPWALTTFPHTLWSVIGILEVVCGIGLIVSGFIKIGKMITVISASVLALLSLAGIVLYSAYSGFPGALWGVIPAVLFTFVAYKRS